MFPAFTIILVSYSFRYKSYKPGIQADRLLCLLKILAHSPFLESQTIHTP